MTPMQATDMISALEMAKDMSVIAPPAAMGMLAFCFHP